MAEKKKKWIKAATDNAHGQFKAKAESAGQSTLAYANAHADDSGKTGKQARLAKTLIGMHKGGKAASHKTIRNSFYGKKD